jgi:hypothetical protein
MVEPPDFEELLDVFEMGLESLVFFGEVFDDLGVLEDHLFNIKDGLLMEGFFKSFSVRSLMAREFSLGLRVESWVGLGRLDVRRVSELWEGLGVELVVRVDNIVIDVVGESAAFFDDVDWPIVQGVFSLFSVNPLMGVSGLHLFCF